MDRMVPCALFSQPFFETRGRTAQSPSTSRNGPVQGTEIREAEPRPRIPHVSLSPLYWKCVPPPSKWVCKGRPYLAGYRSSMDSDSGHPLNALLKSATGAKQPPALPSREKPAVAVVEEEDEITPLQGENKPRTLHTDPDKDALLGTPTNIEHLGVCDVELQFLILDPSMRPKLPLSLQSESQPVPSMWSDPPVLPSLQDSVPEALVPQHQGSWDMADQGAGEKMQCTDEMDDKGSCIPEVVITQADELFGACEKRQQLVVEKPGDSKQTEEIERAVSVDSSYGDGGDFGCSDQQSLKSDSISLTSEATVSGKSYGEQDCEEDDARSVTASSVTSLFQRLQMDPLEREWLRFAALGNVVALRQLLSQDPALASKKTALHWAAKQGRLDMAEMMAQAGVDVNAKSHGGYTALHLAAIHGHHHIIQMLINTCSGNVMEDQHIQL